MKKVIKFLPVAAIVLGSGLAVATTQPVQQPKYGYFNGQWESISPTHTCSDPYDVPCTATDLIDDVPVNVTNGTYAR